LTPLHSELVERLLDDPGLLADVKRLQKLWRDVRDHFAEPVTFQEVCRASNEARVILLERRARGAADGA